MIIAAVIAEYNPFHNGHEYMIRKIKEETGADSIIAIMSGDFTQRGIPGITDKFTRAKMAVSCGIDAVFELPVRYATSSAEFFSTGAVSFLQSLGCIDYLVFGSECGAISDFSKAAEILLQEPESFQTSIRLYQKQGYPYPKAFTMALKESGQTDTVSPALLSGPNNLLGLEYMKALKKLAPSIRPYTISRIGTGYHDTNSSFSEESGTLIASASAIRAILETNTGSISSAIPLLPQVVYQIFSEQYGVTAPITLDDFSLLLSYRLSSETTESLASYLDVSEDLADRISKFRDDYISFTELITSVKHKQYTYTRINRALLHILLQIKKADIPVTVPYARLLAMKKSASGLMKELKIHTDIPVITKPADAKKVLEGDSLRLFQEDVSAANLYSKVVSAKYNTPYKQDFCRSIEIL